MGWSTTRRSRSMHCWQRTVRGRRSVLCTTGRWRLRCAVPRSVSSTIYLFIPMLAGPAQADAMFDALAQQARRQGWPIVRWITADDNHRARAVYDRLADKTHWVTYQMAID